MKKILVMDDEQLVCEIASQIFEFLDCDVAVAHDGLEALDMYKQVFNTAPYDLVVMDLTIPDGIGGKDAISQFLEFDPEAKVIVTSGYTVDPCMVNFEEHGFAGCLAKPFDIEGVEKLLKELFG